MSTKEYRARWYCNTHYKMHEASFNVKSFDGKVDRYQNGQSHSLQQQMKSGKKCFLSSVVYDADIHQSKNDIGINKSWKNFLDASFTN